MNGTTSSLVVMLLWLAPFVVGKRLRLGASTTRRGWLSVAAGMSVAYVLVDLLPQMNSMQEAFSAASAGYGLPFPDFRVHVSALLGFIIFYVLENMVVFSRPDSLKGEVPKSFPVYWLHIFGFACYCALMAYLLPAEGKRTAGSLALYGIAMFFHFWIVDHSLRREHGAPYDASGRWLIAALIPAGWALGTMGVYSDLVVPTLLGLVGGGVVMNSLKEELPEKGQGRALPFVLGAIGYGLLVVMIGND